VTETSRAGAQPLKAVTVIGNDRPGIVAAVTKALFESGCNLEDVSSTILRGHFSMVMIVRSEIDAASLEGKLGDVGRAMELVITARPVAEVGSGFAQPSHMVSVYGADQPGIVFRVADALQKLGANITDLTSRVIGEENEPVYALMLEVSLHEDVDVAASLDSLKTEIGVDVSVHPIEADLL
jgi:glycine cleavage system transcriptional repressor